jgi:uncharacterized protein (TIGR03790 family)
MLPRMRKSARLLMGLAALTHLSAAPLAPNEVVVVFNTAVPESSQLANLYRDSRHIPAANMIGLNMPTTPDISRDDYESTIQNPLRIEFDKRGFWQRSKDANNILGPTSNKIRALVTLRGVPLRIKPVPKPTTKPEATKPEATKAPKPAPTNPIAGRDEAAVDSELAMFGVEGLPIMGVLDNKYFRNEKPIGEANLPFMVLTARIDASSMATCERMIRDAVDTEISGLWGRAYVDIAKKYPMGDKWLEQIVAQNLRGGIPTVVDRFNDTLPKNYPMTQASLYYGWYDGNVSGPFLNTQFRFRKGAVAVHIHSFSAQQLSNSNQNWSAPLLERGATVTVGNVYEPYLELSHYLDILHQRLLAGHSWVEAAWMAMPVSSWQGIVLGDPLYRPFQHFDCNGVRATTDTEFIAVRLAAMKWHDKPAELLQQLQDASSRMKSGTLAEATGLILLENSKPAEAAVWFRNAKQHYTKTEDKLRQDFHLIAIRRAVPADKFLAIQDLRNAKASYGLIPEAAALAAWLDILDPPPPPPANPIQPPKPSPSPAKPSPPTAAKPSPPSAKPTPPRPPKKTN